MGVCLWHLVIYSHYDFSKLMQVTNEYKWAEVLLYYIVFENSKLYENVITAFLL